MNGTVALELALRALEIGSGDEVIVTPRTFIASISCIVNVGAKPVFADVDIDTGNITAQTISAVITSRTKAVICVHLAGWPCDMDQIMQLASAHDLKIIEDCAQAHGAIYKGKKVGSIGHIGAWSFCQDKIMTTGGEGGMVTTNDENLWRFMWGYKDHGKSYDAVYVREHPKGYRWLHDSFGTNWRMLEVQAAIGRIQLRKLAKWTQIRNRNAKILKENLNEFIGNKSLLRAPDFKCGDKKCNFEICECTHAYYKLYLYLNLDNLSDGWDKERVIDLINENGVPCFSGSCSEVYLERAFEGLDCRPKSRLPNAKLLGESALMFLIHPTLTLEEVNAMSVKIKEVLKGINLKK